MIACNETLEHEGTKAMALGISNAKRRGENTATGCAKTCCCNLFPASFLSNTTYYELP